ncbi:MAG: DUF5106 domain-containing protein [Bacteroidales bacterium]|jgi:peroxiredoxin|nr:DUF5106 domain-containing protein [Bacteroidales bacterium]
MSRRFSFFALFFLLCFSSHLTAENKKGGDNKKSVGHEIIFHIKDTKDSLVFLAIHHRDNHYLKDTAFRIAPGKYVSKGDKPLDEGLYTLVSQSLKSYLTFIIDNNQFFEYSLDTTNNVMNFSVKNSNENSEMLRFQQKSTEAGQRARSYQDKIKAFEGEGMVDSVDYYKEKSKALNEEMTAFINELIEKNPNYLFSKLQKAYINIEIPDPPINEDGSIDQNFQRTYYLTHYWDNVDLSDHRFVYLPVLESKYNEYFHKMLQYQHVDTIAHYVDLFLERAAPDSFMFKYFVDRLTYDYQVTKVIGQDAVFNYIVKNYHLKGKTPWVDEDLMKKYKKRIDEMDPLMLGKKCPELTMPDTSGNVWRSTYEFPEKYMIIWFFDPTCSKCKKESAKLKTLYDSLERAGTRNFEVYAVGNDSDVERWKKYVKDNKYPWINVGGNTANMDYVKFFNVIANPSMFVLNKNREFILNKQIEIENLPLFFEEYERSQEDKK